MELVLTSQSLEPLLSKEKCEAAIPECGILNSSYKRLARKNSISTKDNHIFSVRNRVKLQSLANTTPTLDALVKFALFIAFVLMAV